MYKRHQFVNKKGNIMLDEAQNAAAGDISAVFAIRNLFFNKRPLGKRKQKWSPGSLAKVIQAMCDSDHTFDLIAVVTCELDCKDAAEAQGNLDRIAQGSCSVTDPDSRKRIAASLFDLVEERLRDLEAVFPHADESNSFEFIGGDVTDVFIHHHPDGRHVSTKSVCVIT